MSDLALAKIFYCLFKCVGLAPFSYSPKRYFRTSKCSLFYNVFFLNFVTVVSFFVIKASFANDSIVQFDHVIDCSRQITVTLSSIFILVYFCIRQEKCVNVFNRLKSLYELSTSTEINLLAKIFKETYVLTFFAWLPKFITVLVQNSIPLETMIYLVGPFVNDAIISSATLQYSFILRLVKRLFERINANIDTHFSQCRLQLKTTKISRIRELHLSLCELCGDLDSFYSLPMLLSVLYFFVNLVLCSYIAVKFLFIPDVSSKFIVTYAMTHTIHNLAVLSVLTRSTSGVISEVNILYITIS